MYGWGEGMDCYRDCRLVPVTRKPLEKQLPKLPNIEASEGAARVKGKSFGDILEETIRKQNR